MATQSHPIAAMIIPWSLPGAVAFWNAEVSA